MVDLVRCQLFRHLVMILQKYILWVDMEQKHLIHLQQMTQTIKGTVVVSPSELVSSTYQVISDYFDGKDVEPLVNIKLNLCTKDNVSEYQSEE